CGMNAPGTQDDLMLFKVNSALAIKASLGIEAITEDVSSWDVSALATRYKLAKASLLDNLDEAFAELSELVERDEISTTHLLEWPLLAEMRTDRRFTALIAPRLDEASIELLGPEFVILNNRSG